MLKKIKSKSRNRFDRLFWGLILAFGLSLFCLLITFFSLYFSQLSKINEKPIASVSFKMNTAQRRLESSAEWDRLQQNSDLYNGDTVYVAELSQATITFADGSKMYLDEDTMTQIYASKDKSVRASLMKGKALVHSSQAGSGITITSGDTMVNVKKDSVVQMDVGNSDEKKSGSQENKAEVKVIKGNAKVKGEKKRINLLAGESISESTGGIWQKAEEVKSQTEAVVKTDAEEAVKEVEKLFAEKAKKNGRKQTEVEVESSAVILEELGKSLLQESEKVATTIVSASSDWIEEKKEQISHLDLIKPDSEKTFAESSMGSSISSLIENVVESSIASSVESPIESPVGSSKKKYSDEEVGLLDVIHGYVNDKADKDTRPLDQVLDLSVFPRSLSISGEDSRIRLSWRGVDRANLYSIVIYAPDGSQFFSTTVKGDGLLKNTYTLDFSKFNSPAKGTYTWTSQAMREVDGEKRTGPVSKKASFDVK